MADMLTEKMAGLGKTGPGPLRALRRLGGKAYRGVRRLPAAATDYGLPPAWLGYRWMRAESVTGYLERTGEGSYRQVHPEAVVRNPLPCNLATRDELPADRGWWGYSFRDVPERTSDDTFLATVPDCRVVSFVDPAKGNFYPCIVNRDDRALTLREIAFRPGHAAALRDGAEPVACPP